MKMRIFLFAAALALLVPGGRAQTKTGKPAQKAAPPAKAPSAGLPDMILQGKIPEAVRLAAKSPGSAAAALTSLMATSDMQVALRKHSEAQATLESAQKFLEACDQARGLGELPREALRGRQFRMQGIQLNTEKDFARAEAFLRQALKVSRDQKDPLLEAGVHNNLGYALENMNLIEEAAKEYETASKMAEEQKDDLRGGVYTFNLGTVLRKLKRLDPALVAFRRAAEQNRAAGQSSIEARAVLMQGVVAGAINSRSTEATSLFQRAAAMFEKLGDAQNTGWSYYLLGDHIAYSTDFRAATENGEKAVPFLIKANDTAGLLRCYRFLSDLFGRMGDIPNAEKYKKLADALETKK